MKKRNLTICFVAVFLAGIFFSGTTYIVYKKLKPIIKKVADKLETKRIASLPKAKTPFLITDFSNPEDLKKWDFANAKAELSSEHAAKGKKSLKITYLPSNGASAAKIEKYFEKNKGLRDWSQYEAISFDIYNPNDKPQRMLLQIKDTRGERVKIELHLEPKINNKFAIDIAQLWDTLKVNNIAQFNLFLWENSANKTFYLSGVSLLPSAAFVKENKNITDAQFLPAKDEKIYATDDYFAPKSNFTQIPLIISKLTVDNTIELPFSGGIPFGRGQLYSLDKLELVNNHGETIPLQVKVLSKWPDQSIKWALLDTKLSSIQQEYYLKNSKQSKINSRLTLKENSDELTVNTGAVQFRLNKHKFFIFDCVWLDKNNDGQYTKDEALSTKGDLVLVHNGKEYLASLDKNYKLSVEEQGPLKICLKAKGWFVSNKGDKFCQFVTRIYAYEGESYLKIQHAFIYTGYPENRFHYLYEGKRLPKNETINAIYIKTPIKIDEDSKFTFAADNKVMQGGLSEAVNLFQDKFNSYTINTKSKTLNSGNKLDGWIDLSTQKEGVCLGVKNFWQQFPKAFRIDKENQCLTTYLWPQEAGELDLKTTEAATGPDSASRGSAFGLAKTHEVFMYFHRGDYKESQAKNIAEDLSSQLLISASPIWVSDTRVLGRILPYDKRLLPAEEFLSRLFEWGNRQIKDFKWYGMIDFGDTLSWYRQEAYDKSYDDWGWHPEGRWGWFNCEGVGTHTGALIQFLRTGDYKYFDFGKDLARHIMDIDTCHYNTVANDKRLKNVIPDDYSQVGSMHRHNGDHWGGRNEETSHTNVVGLVLYYYITGDERAKDVIDEVGNFILSERITYFRHPDIAPQRNIANVLWSDVALYQLTGNEQYKKAADKWANLLYMGQKYDGSWGENYNPVENRWEGKPHMGYTLGYTLPSLIAYHQLTGNKAIVECIIKATDLAIEKEGYSPHVDADAYCYWLTGDKKYLDNVKNRLDFFINHQKRSEDPIWDGMIYQKPYYARVDDFLYRLPFGLEVLANE